MAIDVAVLRAKLRFESEGASGAAADAKSVEQAIRGVGDTASNTAAQVTRVQETIDSALSLAARAAQSTSFETQKLGQDLKNLVADFEFTTQIVAQADQVMAKYGATEANVSQILQKLRDDAMAAMEAVSALRDAQRNTDIRDVETRSRIGQEIDAEQDRVNRLLNSVAELEGARATLNAAPNIATKNLADIEKQSQRTSKALSGAKKEGNLFTRMLGNFNNGAGFTISNLASLAARATGVGAAAIIAVRGLIGLFRFLGQVARQAIMAADATNAYSSSTHAAADSITNFVGRGGELLAFLDNATNRWESYGNSVEQAQAISSRIAEIGNIAQFLDATPGNATQVLQQIQRAVETLNFDSLRDLGIDVGRVNESFRQLAEDGVAKSVQQGAALAEVARQVNSRLGEANAQLERDRGTLAGLRAEWDRLKSSILQTEEGRAAIRGLVDSLREALPAVAALAYAFGVLLVGAIKAAAAAVEPVLDFMIDRMENFFQNNFLGRAAIALSPELRKIIDDAGGIDKAFDGVRSTFDKIKDIKFDFDLQAASEDAVEFNGNLEEMGRVLQEVRAEAAQGAGLANQIQSLGDAFVAMQEDLNPRTALAGLNQFSSVIDTVISDGIGSLEQFRLRAQAAFELGFFNEAELATANQNFDNIESILGPIARKAEELRMEQERLAQAKLTGITGEVTTFKGEVQSAQGAVQSLAESIIAMDGLQARPQIIVDVVGGDVNLGRGLIPGDLSQIRGGAATLGNQGSRQGGPRPTEPQPNTALSRQEARSLKDTLESVATANKGSGISQAEQERFRADLERQGLFGRTGGGGGGAGNTLATIEQIREFMQEVNRAIGIAARGGVRIGTAGNAIPFEEGTFLNSQGGGLSVDTILIRGVWDFADPAAKRQIIRELQEALTSLQGEI